MARANARAFYFMKTTIMQTKAIRLFIYSSAVLLLATAIAKLVSANGNARLLEYTDSILGIPFRDMFRIVGVIEFVIALICLFSKNIKVRVGLIAWLATGFLIYHIGLIWVGWHKPCPCLGNLTDALHISPQTADTAMKIILAYLLIGSYASLFWLWRQRKRESMAVQ